MKHQNVFSIFEHLQAASKRLTNPNDQFYTPSKAYIKGFENALFVFSLCLKNYNNVNVHLENQRLYRALNKAELRIDDLSEDVAVLKKQNQELQRQLRNQNFVIL